METKKLQKKKRMWNRADEEFLLELWEEKEPQFRGSRKNGHIYQEMAAAFLGRLVEYSTEEVKTKLHNLRSRYKIERKQVGPSGGSPSEWDLYSKVHKILGEHRIHNMDFIVEDSSPPDNRNSTSSYTSDPDEVEFVLPDTSPSSSNVLTPRPRAAKRRRENENEKEKENIDDKIEKLLLQSSAAEERSLQIEEEKLNLMKEFVAESKDFNSKILSLINKMTK